MASRNLHAPYRSLSGAIAHWPETATAVAVRLERGRLQALAPHGLADLRHLVVRPTPSFEARREIVQARTTAKRWKQRWPRLRFT